MANTNNKTFHLVSLNCQGLRDTGKRLRLNLWIKHQNADIVFIQETYYTT